MIYGMICLFVVIAPRVAVVDVPRRSQARNIADHREKVWILHASILCLNKQTLQEMKQVPTIVLRAGAIY